ncbi:MAG: hypothetical protein GY821_08610 [Gammaproteobacteria bacterium]|nr:hypothetical protein [Gammaproteobacteria bacterium]
MFTNQPVEQSPPDADGPDDPIAALRKSANTDPTTDVVADLSIGTKEAISGSEVVRG